MAELPKNQIPAVYHRRVGDMVVTALGDGATVRTHEMMRGVPEHEAERYLREAFRDRFVLSINSFLIRSADRSVLIDTGSGHYLGDEGGKLPASLAAAGVAPADIDTVLLTHMHPDHSAGLTDMGSGRANFPNAELVVHQAEPAHWFDDAAMERGTEREKKLMFQQAREQTAPYRDRMRTFASGEVLPGITAIPLPGHTPGHTGYLVSSGSERLLIWGDIVHIPEVQVPHPEVSMVVDVDPDMAAATRRWMFDMVAAERLAVAGMHLHFPGFGHLARDGGTYRFIPEPWRQEV